MKENRPDENLDILITGGTLLSMSQDHGIVDNPLIGIKNGRVVTIESTRDRSAPFPRASEVIEADNCLIMPGLVNTHTHLPMVCFRGFADDLPLMDWLNNYIFPAEARHVNRDMVYQGSLLAIAEMILSGTTTFCDGYYHESSVAQAALDTGMRAVVAQGFIDLPILYDQESSKKVEIAENFVNRWERHKPMITPAFFCHAPYSCTSETLTVIKEAAVKARIPYLIHLLETSDEIETIKTRYGRPPIMYLEHLGVLDEQTVAVHCNWPDQEGLDILARYDVKVSHNPESSMKLASGLAPVPEMIERGITVGLGTDGCASNNDLDLFREMDTTAKVHKFIKGNPTVMGARTVVEMTTIGGARVLGLDGVIGSIDVGKCADIILIDMNKPHLTPLYNVYSQLVYAACGADVITSIINGKIVMRDRELLTMDLPRVMDDVRKIALDIAKST